MSPFHFDFVCQALRSCDLRIVGAQQKGIHFANICTDSRQVKSDDLFFGLSGERFDGAQFAQQAVEKGAVAVVLPHTTPLENHEGLQLLVDDPLKALHALARAHLQRLPAQRVGITGSVGKTTTKELTKAVLEHCLGPEHVLVSAGNYNNQIGVPLTALQANEKHKVIVFEMGMNHAGEIAQLADIVQPHIAMITNIAQVHQQFFNSIDDIAKAKGELFDAMPNDRSATLIGCQSDERVMKLLWRKMLCNRITFGHDIGSKVWVKTSPCSWKQSATAQHIMVYYQDQNHSCYLPLLGQHNQDNAAAAIAVAMALELDLQTACDGLQTVKQPSRRLQLHCLSKGILLLDDSYNASPKAFDAALKTLQGIVSSEAKRVIACLGDMLELGRSGPELHRGVGEQCVKHGITHLFACGPLSKNYIDGAVDAGMPRESCYHFESSEQLVASVVLQIQENDAVLVKGSLSMRMDQVVKAILDRYPAVSS